MISCCSNKAFALTGRLVNCYYTQGVELYDGYSYDTLLISYHKVRGKKRDFAFGQKKTNGVQSLDTPHLPKYMRKLMQRYD